VIFPAEEISIYLDQVDAAYALPSKWTGIARAKPQTLGQPSLAVRLHLVPRYMFRDTPLRIRDVRESFRQHLREYRRETGHSRSRERAALLELSRPLRSLQLLLFCRDLCIDFRIFRQGEKGVARHACREVTLQMRAVVPDLRVLVLKLVFQDIQPTGQRHALRPDDDTVKIPAMLGADCIAGIDVFSDIRTVDTAMFGNAAVHAPLRNHIVPPVVKN